MRARPDRFTIEYSNGSGKTIVERDESNNIWIKSKNGKIGYASNEEGVRVMRMLAFALLEITEKDDAEGS